MLNPSGQGWINKFFLKLNQRDFEQDLSLDSFYNDLRKTGLIYGHIVSINSHFEISIANWFQTEVSKVALLNALVKTFFITTKDFNTENFILRATSFYNEMNPSAVNLLQKVISGKSKSLQLEQVLDNRVQPKSNAINKNFSNIITNALLFIDVLAFRQYLIHGKIPPKYIQKTEDALVSIVSITLMVKSSKSKFDDLLINLFESSFRYSSFSSINLSSGNIALQELQLDYFGEILEKKYLVDICSMALWSNQLVDKNETYFVQKLGEQLNIPLAEISLSIDQSCAFFSKHLDAIPFFNTAAPVKLFYRQTTNTVRTLLVRNKSRLVREILESKELMMLLLQSTKRDLDKNEKKKVKKQLFDIFKSIPSLAIFLLPGGSLLIPILVKILPSFLPSSFNENNDIE